MSKAVTVTKRRTVNRDAIMNVASTMFRERGYDRTSLDDIAKALSITKPSLYYHFPSKEHILIECIDAGYVRFKHWLVERDLPAASGIKRIGIFIEAYVELLQDNVLSTIVSDERIMSGEAKINYRRYKKILHDALVERIVAGQADGSIGDIEPRFASFAIFGMVNSTQSWPAKDLAESAAEIAARFVQMLTSGIGRR